MIVKSVLATLFFLLLAAAPLQAQEAAEETEASAETKPAPAVSNEAKRDNDDSAARASGKPSTEVFVPTEEVSVDRSISMPVDI